MNHNRSDNRFVLCLLAVFMVVGLLVGSPATGVIAAPRGPLIGAAAHEQALLTPELIDQAFANGEITADQRLLYLAYAVYEYESLPVQFRSNVGWSGTATVVELRETSQNASQQRRLLSRSTYNELDRVLTVPAATICDQVDGSNNDSTSANFYINYESISDPDLTLANYRQALDDTFAIEITSYDRAKPTLCDGTCSDGPPPDNKYPVQIADIGGGLYGYVSPGGGLYAGYVFGDNPNTPAPEIEIDSVTSCMVLNDDYTTNGLGGLPGLRVTAAHEYVHAIQFGYGDPSGYEDSLWYESIAAYMEDEVLDASNDNYQYLWPEWTESLGQWPADNHYANWILYRYAAEHNGGTNKPGSAGGGENVIQDIWKGIAQGDWGVVAFNNGVRHRRHDTGRHLSQLCHCQPLPNELSA